MRQCSGSLPVVVVLLALLGSANGYADDLFSDDFSTPGVDPAKWAVMGDGVSNPGGKLQVVCTYWWNDGVQSIPTFERPDPGDQLVVEGRFMMPADNPRCASIVWLQLQWGHPYNGHALEFAKDQNEPGVNLIFYSTQEDDLLLEYEEVGVFEEGEWVGWRFVLYDIGCELYVDTGEAGSSSMAECRGLPPSPSISMGVETPAGAGGRTRRSGTTFESTCRHLLLSRPAPGLESRRCFADGVPAV